MTFANYCVRGIKANKKRIAYLLENSLMLITALAPMIGYDKAAKIANQLSSNGTTLNRVIKNKILSEKEYDKIMKPILMTRPK